MKKPAFWPRFLLALVLLAVFGGCAAPEPVQSLDEQAQEIYRSLMCPLCPGQTIDQSQSELSAQMRAIVREKLEQGETKEEILQFFVERYGEAVLALPSKTGLNLVAWFAPIVALITGGLILWLFIWRRVRFGKASPGTVSPTADETGSGEYGRRLEKELRDFDKKGFR